MPYIGNQPAPQNVTSTEITDGTITNADINASAAIDISKLNGVTATNTELNKLDGYTGDVNDLNTVDVTTLGTVEASKVVTADANGDVTFGDDGKVIFGAGSDLQLYHDGSHSYVTDEGVGNMYVRSNGAGVVISNQANSPMAQFLNGNACELRFNHVTRFATTSVGADVTGELIADSYNETYAAVTSSSNATTVDCEAGNAFSHTLTENTTFTFSNPPASGTAYSFSIEIIQDASASGFTVTWPSSVDWPSATAPTLTATASAKDVFVFTTRDGGTNWYGFTAGQALG
jgi:hypothetical protein